MSDTVEQAIRAHINCEGWCEAKIIAEELLRLRREQPHAHLSGLGNPDQACGRGICGLGDGHAGQCRA
jgi:hypothetical protein